MSLFDIEEPIDYQWLINNGFNPRMNDPNDDGIMTKSLRFRNPFVYLQVNKYTFDTILCWVSTGKNRGLGTQVLYLGSINDRLKMISLIHKYSQENCLI